MNKNSNSALAISFGLLASFIGLIVLVILLFAFWRFSFALLFLSYLFYGAFRHMRQRRRNKLESTA